MKKYFFILMLIVTIYSVTPQKTYAFDVVFDPIMYLKQGLQYINEIEIKYSGAINAANTTATRLNQLVLQPAKDYATFAAIVSSTNNIQNLILGGLGNNASLLIANPELYLKNKGTAAIQANLNTISNSKGVYSNSILNSVINSTKIANNTAGTLASLSQSSIPSTVQNNLCSDDTLTRTAKIDVTKNDGSYDPAELTTRKSYLYNTLCMGNPNTDSNLAKTLMSVNQQRPSIGGLDTWLAITGGDNPFNAAIQAQQVIAKDATTKIDMATQDINRGGGLKSMTTCDAGATDPSLPCSITKTSASLKAMWDESIASPLKTLQGNLAGTGSLIGTIFNSISLINGISTAVNQTSSNLGGGSSNSGSGSGGGTLQINIPTGGGSGTQPNTAVTTTGTSSVNTQDPFFKTTMADPIVEMLNEDLKADNQLQPIDQNYLSVVNAYEYRLTTATSCYAGLVRDFSAPATTTSTFTSFNSNITYLPNPVDPTFVTFYNDKQPPTEALQRGITAEINNIPIAINLVYKSLAVATSSNSTGDVTDSYTTYQNQISTQQLPNDMTVAIRTSDLQKYQDAADQNNADVQTYIDKCNQIRIDMEKLRQQNTSG